MEDKAIIIAQIIKVIPGWPLVMSDILPARGGPERAARPPPAVSRPKAGVNKWKLKVLMISGVSQATHIPVQKPKPEERRRKKMYFEQAVSKNACPLAPVVAKRVIVMG